MDFVSVTFLLTLYYLRIQEWSPILGALKLVSLTFALAIFGMFIRPAGFSPRNFLRSPHDWAIVFFLGWIIYSASYWKEGFNLMQVHLLYYVLIVQALSSLSRIRRFVAVWTFLLFVIAALAVASEFGFDPFENYERTHGMWKGRLALHLSGFHNPNSLGHVVVPVLAGIYFFWVWKRPIFVKEVAIPLMALPIWCIYLTQSKGAFLVGFVTLVVAFVFGRPRVVQMLVLVFALTIGIAGLYQLPRMQQMRAPLTDAGILGRVNAFKFGLVKLEEEPKGVGINRFAVEASGVPGVPQSPHSSYVGIAVELGYVGLFFYLCIAYCCFRTLVTAKNLSTEEERIRRILVVFLAAHLASGWLINWSYNTPFFILAAVVAAFHRHLHLPSRVTEEKEQKAAIPMPQPGSLVPSPIPALAPAGMGRVESRDLNTETVINPRPIPSPVHPAEPEATPLGIRWNRIGIVDLVIVWLLTEIIIRLWRYVITNM